MINNLQPSPGLGIWKPDAQILVINFESQYPNFNIKETLLQKQFGRCYSCGNFIMKNDLLDGGQNNIENIGFVHSVCYQWSLKIF
jgi:hypothetical protein